MHINKNLITTVELEKLRELIFNYKNDDEKLVDEWFVKHEISSNKDKMNCLGVYILNQSYFFSFRSLNANDDVAEESRIRHLVILKHLDLDNQLKILPDMVTDLTEGHFKLLKINSENVNTVENYYNMCYVVSKLFNSEKFDLIDNIENIIKEKSNNNNFNLLNVKSKYFSYFYKEENSHGFIAIKMNKKIAVPIFDIITNYTESKKDYLNKKKINLPSYKDLERIKKGMVSNELDIDTYMESIIKKCNEKIIEYNFIMLNNKINKDVSGSAIKRNKI